MKILKLLPLLIIFLGVLTMKNVQAEGFKIKSNSFLNGGILPNKQIYNNFGCTGENISPHLKWEGAPKETKSFALIAHDPDAPRQNGWYHWIILNIPANITSLEEGQQINSPMVEIKNDFGFKNYGGACPPKGHGTHHYNFTIYALDTTKIEVETGATPEAIKKSVEKRALASATVTALYSRD